MPVGGDQYHRTIVTGIVFVSRIDLVVCSHFPIFQSDGFRIQKILTISYFAMADARVSLDIVDVKLGVLLCSGRQYLRRAELAEFTM